MRVKLQATRERDEEQKQHEKKKNKEHTASEATNKRLPIYYKPHRKLNACARSLTRSRSLLQQKI